MTDVRDAPALARTARATGTGRGLVVLYCVTACWSSTLLFTVQPMVARQLLPLLGGSASVWNTAMVFFQGALLAGYLIAHLTTRWGDTPRRTWVQVGVVAVGLAVLPVGLPAGWQAPAEGGQAMWVMGALALSVGLPFVGLSTLGPTLQAWFAATDHPRAADPYFLYAAGNVGSAVGLLAYPLVLEPRIGLQAQAELWAVADVVLVGLVVTCAVAARRHRGEPDAPTTAVEAGAPISGSRRLRWIVLAALPSALMLATTRHLTTDVASIPLLWVIPLLVYLGTFVVAFGRARPMPGPRQLRWTLALILPVALTVNGTVGSIGLDLAVHVAGFGAMALWCHCLLAADRPPATHLTGFYLAISIGGVTGGAAVALVAPLAFDRITEYPLLIVAVLVAIALAASARRWARVAALGVAAVAIVPAVVDPAPVLHRSRSFFGVSTVELVGDTHRFVHGTTIHGVQRRHPSPSTEPLGYYGRGTGLGRMLAAVTATADASSIGAVGLGTGNLVAYGGGADRFAIYEIDADVVSIAEDPSLFTFLADTPAEVEVIVADGRLGLAGDPAVHDALVLDAFSSDAIPTHLLTREAMAVYRSRLADDGVMLVHVSNRHFDLRDVVARSGATVGLGAWSLATDEAVWVALAGPDARPAVRRELAGWTPIRPGPDTPLWTDDHTDLLATLGAPR